MKTKKKADLKKFGATVRISGELSVDILAETWEDALAQAKTLVVPDVVDRPKGGWYDYDPVVLSSIWEN